ncbi:craniofacial development protein 2-like [Sitophilus oryzae]|uniref:Craniofacial development protein 2-like n=1 Tax=Sitophilus oryzae TaxID=7048 RepID=A0A6J2YJ31_SITOR|nr:craniofacial development protein 2-like [Sitophilus oryzae]
MNIRGYRLTIIGVYAVNDDSPTASKDTFFQQLNDEIIKTGKTREIFLLGDLNSRTGKSDNDVTIGKYGEDTLINNGERLIDMCKQNNLRILNGFYQHRNIHKYTWIQGTKKLRSIIDYVITKQKTKLQIQDVRVYRGAICGSDHHLLKAKIFLPYKREK